MLTPEEFVGLLASTPVGRIAFVRRGRQTEDQIGHRARMFRAVVLMAAALGPLALVAACTPPPLGPLPPVVDHFQVAASGFTAPALVPLSWEVHDANNDVLTCRVDGDGDGTWDATVTPCPASGSRNVSAAVGNHVARFEVADQASSVATTASYSVSSGPTEPYNIVAQQITTPDPRVTEAIDDAIARWQAVLARGVPDMAVHSDAGTCGNGSPAFDGTVDDIHINVAVIPLSGLMGEAASCVNGPDSLPRLSFIHIDQASIDWLYSHGYLGDLVTHEMGHALGFTGPTWWAYRQDAGTDGFRFTGPRAMAEYSRLGGSGTVPLDNGGGHWNETIFQSENMTCYLENLTSHPLSALTVAAMADSGYHVDLAAAEPYTLPPQPGLTSC